MSPCTEQSRKSIHCMGRKRRIFTLFTLRILLTALSSGIITNSIPAWKAMMREPGARWVPTIYLHSFPGSLEACVGASLHVAQDQGEISLLLNPPLIPMSSHLRSYWVSCKSLLLRHPLFLWQCSADDLCWGLQGWMCVIVGGGGISPLPHKKKDSTGTNTSVFSLIYSVH